MNKPCVAVVGGVNVDICGKSRAPLIPADSNPGTVRLSLGGVGRNVAHNLCLLGVKARMLTALAEDGWAEWIRRGCAAAGIDLSHARSVPGEASSTYLAIEGPEGDLSLALCDNALARSIDPPYLAARLPLLNEAAAVVLDANLEPEALNWLAEHVTAPLFADPVSVTKAEKLRPILGRLHTLKPNRLEAELLSGIPITDRNSLDLAAAKLLSTGLRRVCVSLGSEGVYCAWDAGRCLVPCPETRLVNASGGGDAMMAGFVRAFLDGLPIEQAAGFALACSSIAVESPETVNPCLSLERARTRAVGAVIGRPEEPSPAVGAVIGRPEEPSPAVGAVIGRLEEPSPAVGAVIGRPEKPSPAVGAVIGRPEEPSPAVGAVIGRPEEPSPAVGAVIGRLEELSPAVGAVIGRPEEPSPAVGAVIGRPEEPSPAIGAVIGRPEEPSPAVGAVIGRPKSSSVAPYPIRRKNRLEACDYSQGGAYHVVICTDRRQCILSEVYEGEDTQQLRLYPLGTLVEAAILEIPVHYPTVSVIRYSVMPNHVHLLLQLSTDKDNPTIPWIVNQLKGIVSKRAGKRIWQKGFYDQVIRTESEFRMIGEYIEYNPAKWKTDDYYVSPV